MNRRQQILKLREKRAKASFNHKRVKHIDAKLQPKMLRQLKAEIRSDRHGNV